MAELGIAVAGKLIEVIGSAAIKEICDMWGYKSQLEDLSKTVSTIEKTFLDADTKRELTNEEHSYIEELKFVVYDADDLFDELLTLAELKQLRPVRKGSKLIKKVRCFFSSDNQPSLAYRMSSRVKEIKKKLDETVNNHRKFEFKVDNNPIVRRKEESCSYVVAEDIIGREEDKKVVIDMLLASNDVHERFRVVTIVGVGGLGKTALAQLVFNDKKVEEEFPDPKLRLWVCVSDQDGEQFDVKSILCNIVEVVSGQKPSDTASLEWVQKRIQGILGGKKYLLVLDDVWNEVREKWHSLQRFLMIGEEGSRIVVTTRSLEAGEIIGDKHIYKLEGLSHENSWRLFETAAFNKGQEHENHLELVEIGKKIVEKCCNIPLALKVVGSLLFGQHVNKWHSFERSGLAEIENGENKIMCILKLSYHNLRPSLKNCFSYCAIFPKDFEIEKEELISLWIAQGYIVSIERGQSIEDAAEDHFLILLRRCFFQDVKKDEYGVIQSVKIHDLMHDVAQEVGRKERSVVSSNTLELGNKIRHVYNVSDNCPQRSLFKKSKIRSFILSPRHRALEESIQMDCWLCLRVLRLKSLNIRTYPESIGKLLHLRYLNLSRNHILVALPDSIIKLHNLQTLLLSDCNNLKELPKSFSKLVKLRHLDLSRCRELTILPSGMGELTSLRHLGLEECYKLTGMPSGMDKLTRLRVLPFFVVGKGQRVSSEEQDYAELKDLKALSNLNGGIYIDIGKYYIEDLNNGEDEYLKSMKHITEVNISFDFSIDADRYPDCEVMMEKLEPHSDTKRFIIYYYRGTIIPRWGREEDNWALSLPNLVHIELISCKKLEQVPSLSTLRFLKSLVLVELSKLEYIDNKISNTGSGVGEAFFPFLESLIIQSLPNLKGWWRGEELIEDENDHTLKSRLTFPRLLNLKITYCCNLVSFPSCSSLEYLKLHENNKKLRVVVNRRNKEVVCAGNAQSDISLKVEIDSARYLNSIHLPCLTSLSIGSDKNMESLSEYRELFRSCTSLRSLTIDNCTNLKRLTGGEEGLELLTALEELQFSFNDQLSFTEDIADDDGMPWKSLHRNLRSLTFFTLKNMNSLPKGIQYLTSLQSLSIYNCGDVKAPLPEWISCLSSLQTLTVVNQ